MFPLPFPGTIYTNPADPFKGTIFDTTTTAPGQIITTATPVVVQSGAWIGIPTWIKIAGVAALAFASYTLITR